MNLKTKSVAAALVGLVGCATAASALDRSPSTSTDFAPNATHRAVGAYGPEPTPRRPATTSDRSSPAAARAESPRKSPRPDPTAVRPLRTSPPGALDKGKARSIVTTVVQRPVASLRGPKEVQRVFSPLTAGRFLSELKAQQGELQENGWTQSGTPSVRTLKVTSLKGKTATVSACIEQSGVSLRDAKGRPIGSSDVPRARHLYDLVQQQPGKTWRIAAHRFPTDPTC